MITTVIPTLGRPSLYERAIPSVAAQTVPGRLLVVGDGVDVGHLSIERPDYPPSELEHWRVGGVRAFNHGLDLVETEWVSYLADDDEYTPIHHEALLGRASSDVDVVYGQSRTPGRQGLYGTHWPPDPYDICQGAYIFRASLGMRASEVPGAASWDVEWWNRLLAMGARFARVEAEVHVYHPAPETRGFH